MFKLIKKFHHGAADWIVRKTHSRYATWILSVVSFTESSLLPFPPDILLIPMTASRPSKWARFALVTAGMSVLGGIAGYFIGVGFFDVIGAKLVETYNLQDEMISVAEKFDRSAFWAVLISAFTPIPYKVFTISAGLFKVNFVSFIVASIIGRFARFYIESWLVYKFGKPFADMVRKHFDRTAIVLGIVLVAGVVVWLLLK